jgi:hypothetical protein
MLRIPHCLDSRLTDGGKVVIPTHRPLSTPQKHYYFSASGTHFCWGLSKSQVIVWPEGWGKSKRFIHLIGSRTRDRPKCWNICAAVGIKWLGLYTSQRYNANSLSNRSRIRAVLTAVNEVRLQSLIANWQHSLGSALSLNVTPSCRNWWESFQLYFHSLLI